MVFRSSLVAALSALVFSATAQAGNPSTLTGKDELCSLVPNSYGITKQTNPELAFAIDELSTHSIATWYSDRTSDYESIAQRLVSTCPESSRMSVVVYGLPKKDCEAGYSSSGTIQSTSDYVQFLQKLMNAVKDRKILYVLEPDAVGLLAKEGGCGEAAGYRDNLKTAIQMLSQNPNAEIYLDVGYWSLAYPEPRQRVVEVIKNLVSEGGRVKGITLNTSNYRKTDEIVDLCSKFQSDMGSMNCIIDTSRNYRGSPSTEWCNVGSAGIGMPPTSQTGLSNIDYFLWIKPPGESDGTCDGAGHTQDATRGPAAGDFFVDGFKKLWDYGYFVDGKHMPSFDGNNNVPTPDPTSFYQTSAPSTPAPEVTTWTPTTVAPEPETTTSTPVTSTPDVTTSAPDATTSTPVTSAPETTTPAPEATTKTPEATTKTPEATTSTPDATTSTPEATTKTPEATTKSPEATTSSPSSTTPSPVLDSTPAPSATPETTTSSPSSGTTDVPTISPSSGSSVGSSTVDEPTPRPSFRHTKVPKTKEPKTDEETPSPTDFVQNSTPAPADGGPETIASNPNVANNKSGNAGSSGAGGIIAAVLIAAVAAAVAAAVFVHIRRRAQDAVADDMKTPVNNEVSQQAYLSQL